MSPSEKVTMEVKVEMLDIKEEPLDFDNSYEQSHEQLRQSLHHEIDIKNEPDLYSPSTENYVSTYINRKLSSKYKPFECSTCGKQFTCSWYLKTHMTIHTGEKPFHCHVCNKSFYKMTYLKKHQRIHSTIEKPFQCDMCDKQFERLHSLQSHQRIHNDEKPFQCELCKKQFKLLAHLRRHERIHSGAKLSPNRLCHFKHPSGLKRHVRTHSDDKPYQCDKCDKQLICDIHDV